MADDTGKSLPDQLLAAKQRISELEKSELAQQYLSAIVDSADDAIISKNLDGIITSWNPGAEKIFGYTAEEMIGKPIILLIPIGHSNEEATLLARLRRGERIDHYETQRMRKDGSVVDVSVTISPIMDSSGKVIGASKIARDISDRKRLQEAQQAKLYLGSLIESADDAIISKTLDGIVTSWNRGAERIFGYAAEEMIGTPITILIPADHPNEEPEIIARLRRGERIEHYETQRVRKDGTLVYISLMVSPIIDEKGRIIGASKIARDISDRKRVEEREREALRQAEAASRAKDEFLATVSHELRTPLTAILGWVKMLTTGTLDANATRKALEVIDRNVKAQTQLIEDLLDVSRIISGKLRIEVKPLDPSAVISAAVDVIKPAADAKHIRVQTVCDAAAGPIAADFHRLQQIVWNLLSNAVKFTPQGGSVRIELSRGRSQVLISVTDSGIGIRKDFLPFVFNRFSQADSSITRSHGGLGMGLAITRSLVELHGGTIGVSSPGEGQGSTFVVALPVSAMSKRPVEQPVFGVDMRGPKELRGVKILVVDDEVDACEMLQFLFQQSGAEVEVATSAEKALEVIDQFSPDVLVSDIGMPDVDGYELIRRIRRSGRNTSLPAVALTALTRIEDRMQALAAGYQMHVAKPVEPVELLAVVSSLAGRT
jgi:PAS domain S-box-containing protein